MIHGPLPRGGDRLAIADTIIAALARHDAPAFGFVNGGFRVDDANSPRVLALWRMAGLPVGDHTFDYRNLAQTTAADLLAQVGRDEAVT